MSTVYLRSIRQSIDDCDRFIAKEGPRDPSLRPAAVQATLDCYIAHRAKLQAMQATLLEFSVVLYCDGTHYVGRAAHSVAIGKFGGPVFNVPNGHAWYDRVAEVESCTEAASYFEELVAALAD